MSRDKAWKQPISCPGCGQEFVREREFAVVCSKPCFATLRKATKDKAKPAPQHRQTAGVKARNNRRKISTYTPL